jgi:hypothetical protein
MVRDTVTFDFFPITGSDWPQARAVMAAVLTMTRRWRIFIFDVVRWAVIAGSHF